MLSRNRLIKLQAQPFILFGQVHIVTLMIIFFLCLAIPKYLNNSSWEITKKFGYVLATLLLVDLMCKPYYLSTFGYPYPRNLPIHMCSLSTMAISLFLLTNKKIFYEIAYFWGIGGGIMALLQPDTPRAFPDLQFIAFFFGHGGLFLGIAIATFTMNQRPTQYSLLKVLGLSLIVLPLMYLINNILGPPANYWYLGARPEGASILDFFPDPPLHIPLVMAIGIVMFFLLYIPYWIKDGGFTKGAESIK